MTQEHPLTPPPELLNQWLVETIDQPKADAFFAARAAQWGADQELEACCEWFQSFYKLESWMPRDIERLRVARRPKPPSLKEMALDELDGIAAVFRMSHGGDLVCDKIRRALEALPND